MRKLIVFGIWTVSFFNQAQGQRLAAGDTVPTVEVADIYGDTIRVNSANASRVWIAFMRYAGCPTCNMRVHELTENTEIIARLGYELILVYESSPAVLRQYLEDTTAAPFKIVGDPERRLYQKFGVTTSLLKTFRSGFNAEVLNNRKEGQQLFFDNQPGRDGRLTGLPADFLINTDGTIQTAYYGEHIADHLPLTEVPGIE